VVRDGIRDEDRCFQGELPERPGPTSPVREILASCLKQHGIGGDPALRRVHAAWRGAAGREFCEQTRVTGLRKGVLHVEVDSAALLQELSVYRKRELLLALRQNEPTVSDIKFRAGAPGRRRPASDA
jgi:predicted nucleic acid-binding Zn ribbon protein